MGRKNSKKKKIKEKQKISHHRLLKGNLEITRSGMGFVTIEGMDTDILIRPGDFNTALHGDTVLISIKEEKGRGHRLQGMIKEVLQRKRIEFVGHLEIHKSPADSGEEKGFAFFIADMDKPMPDVFIPLSKLNQATEKDKVVVRILEWDNSGKRPLGEVVSILDPAAGNEVAMQEILLEHGFPLQFSDDALEVAARIPDTIPEDEIRRRKDMRDVLTFTIDPTDAKDFDDAISIRKLKNGSYEIGVHIADVSHYVEPDTALDSEAYQRATSVYLPDRVNPMLPEHISNFLCSLRPREDKLTFSAVFQVTPKAEVKQYWLGKTIIHSDHRFTYEEVQAIIEEEAGLYSKEILLLNDIAQRMRKKRFHNGAINFSSQEVRFRLNEEGMPIGIMIKESFEAHQLIEELMLLANRTVAENISRQKVHNKPLPFPYRVHDDPDEEKLLPFAAFAKKFGHKFDTSSPEAIAASFNQLLKDAHGRPEQHVLEQLGIRTMAKAKYTIENIGHYGLGFKNYCHFTSPIRRYPDILAHRILYDVLNNKIQPDKKMDEKCKHSSVMERGAMEAERAANKFMQVLYMKNYLGEEFEGVISGVASFGFWVETIEHKCEGLVSVNSLLEYDEFRHEETDYCLVGRRSGKKFRMGDKVWIKVVAANLTKRQLDYEWVVAGEVAREKKLVKIEKVKDKSEKIKTKR
jgi:ribonuclease R